MTILIRRAELNDTGTLAEMNDRLVADQGSQNPFTIHELEARFRDWLQTGSWQVDLILEGQRIVGYAVYQSRADYYYPDQPVVYIRQFYIERTERGRGVGRAAFHALVETRFPKGQALALDVVATNQAGYAFWSTVGFAPYFIAMKKQADS